MNERISRAPINRIPTGLLDLLGIKSLGQNPIDLAPQVIPVLDLVRFYGIDGLSVQENQAAQSADAPGDLCSIAPSQGKMWLVASVGFRTVNPLLSTHNVTGTIQLSQGTNSFPILSTVSSPAPFAGAGITHSFRLGTNELIVVPSGWSLGGYITYASGFAANARTFVLKASVLELRV